MFHFPQRWCTFIIHRPDFNCSKCARFRWAYSHSLTTEKPCLQPSAKLPSQVRENWEEREPFQRVDASRNAARASRQKNIPEYPKVEHSRDLRCSGFFFLSTSDQHPQTHYLYPHPYMVRRIDQHPQFTYQTTFFLLDFKMVFQILDEASFILNETMNIHVHANAHECTMQCAICNVKLIFLNIFSIILKLLANFFHMCP